MDLLDKYQQHIPAEKPQQVARGEAEVQLSKLDSPHHKTLQEDTINISPAAKEKLAKEQSQEAKDPTSGLELIDRIVIQIQQEINELTYQQKLLDSEILKLNSQLQDLNKEKSLTRLNIPDNSQ